MAAATPLRDLVNLFVRLGVTSFGGPAAHIAMMRDEVVRRRSWIADDEFARLVGATNLIPGPNSTELAMHLGARRAGGRGLVVAGLSFIVPAVVIVSVIAWLYAEHGTDPLVFDIRYGVLPVIIAVIAQAVWGLTRSSVKNIGAAATAGAALAAYLWGVHELIVLLALGLVWAAVVVARNPRPPRMTTLAPSVLLFAVANNNPTLLRLFLIFLEVGSVLYGSGYVLVAFLDSRLVTDHGYLTAQQLLDAVAVGQITPGPVFTTATFIGWQILGVAGAALATIGIFGPSFVFVALLDRFMRWIEARPAARAFLTGVTMGSLGLMAGVLVRLADDALVDWFTWIIAAAALALLVFTRVSAAWLVPAGVLIGIIHQAAT
ncbi:MAG: chromate efflux transporter [Actinomycetota bacterium]